MLGDCISLKAAISNYCQIRKCSGRIFLALTSSESCASPELQQCVISWCAFVVLCKGPFIGPFKKVSDPSLSILRLFSSKENVAGGRN